MYKKGKTDPLVTSARRALDNPGHSSLKQVDTADLVEAYILEFPESTRAILRKLRATIREAVPDAEERISYRMPAYFLGGALVYFAAFARHIGFYPTASGIASFETELSAYKHAKGSVQFPLDKAIPYDLVARIAKFRAEENRAKSARVSLSEQ